MRLILLLSKCTSLIMSIDYLSYNWIIRSMPIDYAPLSRQGLSAQIADSLRDAITSGELSPDDRLPSESELAERFGVSRPTVREALKRLAAQNLIRTKRGASGGAFVNRISWDDAYDQIITTSTLMISMHAVDFETMAEARFLQERACLPLAIKRRQRDHLATMRQEISRQQDPALSDEAFCASDVAFHRALVDAAQNPVLSYQRAGAVEAMQPLMNMLTFRARDRNEIVRLHNELLTALSERDLSQAQGALDSLSAYTAMISEQMRSAGTPHSTTG